LADLFGATCTWYDTRCYFNVRSKADISQLNLPHGSDRATHLTVIYIYIQYGHQRSVTSMGKLYLYFYGHQPHRPNASSVSL